MANKLIAHLYRSESTPDGTFGRLVFSDSVQFITGELPWRDNKSKISCIPVGIYNVKSYTSPKFGKCYIIDNTSPRSGILIHAANYCGLASEGKKQELNGCIALGLGLGIVNKQKILTSSRAAILKFQQALNWQDFTLTIT